MFLKKTNFTYFLDHLGLTLKLINMMNTKDFNQNVGWFLAFAGVNAFLVSLIHPKSRVVTKKVVALGGGIAVDYALTRYLPKIMPGLLNLFTANMSGFKGGVSKKSRRFKKKLI